MEEVESSFCSPPGRKIQDTYTQGGYAEGVRCDACRDREEEIGEGCVTCAAVRVGGFGA